VGFFVCLGEWKRGSKPRDAGRQREFGEHCSPPQARGGPRGTTPGDSRLNPSRQDETVMVIDDKGMYFVERHSLRSKRIGCVDVHLLATVALSDKTMNRTLDQHLSPYLKRSQIRPSS